MGEEVHTIDPSVGVNVMFNPDVEISPFFSPNYTVR